jgi:DNA-binding transcriptional LysR family regulator
MEPILQRIGAAREQQRRKLHLQLCKCIAAGLMTNEPVASEELTLVAAVASARRLPEAARQLRVDHSTLYRRLASVERRLNVALFDRDRGLYTPTSAGRVLLEAAAQWRGQQAELSAALAAVVGGPEALVRLTTTEDVAMTLLPACLQVLREHAPHCRVDVLVDDRPLDLARSDADVAIRPTRNPPLGWVGVNLGRIDMATYRAAGESGSTPAAAGEPAATSVWVMRSASTAPPADLAWMQAHVPAQQVAATFNRFSALLAAAEAGLGAVLLPRFVGDRRAALRRDASAHLALPGKEASRLWLLCHPRMRKEPRIVAFFRAAKAAMTLEQGHGV